MIYTEIKNAEQLDGQSAYVWRFDSTVEFSEACKKEKAFYCNTGDSESRWTGESTDGALRKCITGDDASVAAAMDMLEKVDAAGIDTARSEYVPSVVGAYPVVGDFLAGRPDSMRRRISASTDRAPVRVYVNGTSSGGIDSEKLVARGTAILAMCMLLSAERPVELYSVVELDAYGRHCNGSFAVIRIPSAPLELATAAFALTNQGLIRDLGYGWLCKKAKAKGGWAWGDPPQSERSKKQYMKLSRAALGCEPQDLYVPAIALHDKLTDDPIGWINDTLAMYRSTDEQQAA